MQILILFILPAVFGASVPEKRLLFDTFLNGEEARHLVDQLVELLATDDNEVKCESHCHTLIANQQSVMQHLCPFLCHSAQNALNHLHSPNTDPTVTGKRLVLDNFLNTAETAHLVDQLVANLGTDENEAACEKECHVLIRDSTSVFQHMCPFLCHSAQAVINSIHHTPSGSPTKRFLVDTLLANPEVNVLVTGLVDVLGSDPTEQQCERECVVLMHADNVLHHLCPFVCHSFQQLVSKIHLNAPASNPSKRFLVDTLLHNNPDVAVLVNTLVQTLGSDPTEAACESKCTVVVHADNFMHYLCPLVCHSFQSLVQKIHIDAPSGSVK
ncbi:uncharacterized protein LOC134280155 [Saccostrea cucullata]|uniref:uncharacterized protein LOC134280155 n=1 Tax=Saccostrea cuccullata TaxID=36930 RepID=UPI002ED4F5E5